MEIEKLERMQKESKEWEAAESAKRKREDNRKKEAAAAAKRCPEKKANPGCSCNII